MQGRQSVMPQRPFQPPGSLALHLRVMMDSQSDRLARSALAVTRNGHLMRLYVQVPQADRSKD